MLLIVAVLFLAFGANNVFAQSVSLSTNAVEIGQTVVVFWSGFNGNVNIEVWKGNTFWVYASKKLLLG
jgi:hypothetical protein